MRWVDLIAVVALAVAAGGWVVLQRFIARVDPGNPGLDRDCDGGCKSCDHECHG